MGSLTSFTVKGYTSGRYEIAEVLWKVHTSQGYAYHPDVCTFPYGEMGGGTPESVHVRGVRIIHPYRIHFCMPTPQNHRCLT